MRRYWFAALTGVTASLLVAAVGQVTAVQAQIDGGAPRAEDGGRGVYESKFVEAGGVRLHYLDFGGEGLPVVFLHSESWNAYTYKDFAPRFADRSRVLALTRRGYGESEGHGGGYDVPSQAKSVLDFLDALGIERAVFAGNSSPTAHMTYLVEHHPERVAGLIYLAGPAPWWLGGLGQSDPYRAGEMASRATGSDSAMQERLRTLFAYRPEFVRGDLPPITVAALTFVARSGTRGTERMIDALSLVGSPLLADVYEQMPPSPWRDHLERLVGNRVFRRQELEQIADGEARAYFLRLADDQALQAAVYRYHQEVVLPAFLGGQEQFRRAFGQNLRVVRLDVPEVHGYEYRDSPELIEPHIRSFLEEIGERERRRSGMPAPSADREQAQARSATAEPARPRASGVSANYARGADGGRGCPSAPCADRSSAR